MSYQTSVTEKGVSVTAFEGVEAVTDVLEQASIMPVKYISRVEKALQKINASSENTVCIDFCTGNDAAVLTTMYSILEKKKISLTGGTGDGGKVSVNGTVYTDADVFAFVKIMAAKSGFTRKIFIIRTHSTVLLHQRQTAANTQSAN